MCRSHGTQQRDFRPSSKASQKPDCFARGKLPEYLGEIAERLREQEKIEEEEKERRRASILNFREETRIWQTQYEGESVRRKALSPAERLREDGQELQQQLETDGEIFAALEQSASERAKCRAEDDCLGRQINHYHRIGITDEYRICLHGVQKRDWSGRRKSYYHVRCFSHMVDLYDLMPHMFKLDGAIERWQLMVQKWYQHKGHVDPVKITAHIAELQAYFSTLAEKYAKVSDWERAHMQCCINGAKGECECPERPTRPLKPTL